MGRDYIVVERYSDGAQVIPVDTAERHIAFKDALDSEVDYEFDEMLYDEDRARDILKQYSDVQLPKE